MRAAALGPEPFAERLRNEAGHRYHDRHPFHALMHEGRLNRRQLQGWVLNRYYYQTRIPVKDALILAKSEDPAFRRAWRARLEDQDGSGDQPGGLALWLRLAEGVGLPREAVAACTAVLPGVRLVCDGYVELVRRASLVEAVAASLTELFAPDLMARRIAAWERHYPWVEPAALAYFRGRVPRARHDGEHALAFVLEHAVTPEVQERCLRAFVHKTDILWRLLDCVHAAYVEPGAGAAVEEA